MADKPTLAQAWIGLVPTLDGSQKVIEKELSGIDGGTAGTKVGKKFGAALKVGALAAVALVAKGVGDSIVNATALEQSIGGVDAVFKNNAKQVHAWADSAASDVGLSANSYNELATVIGSQLKNAGTSMDEVAGKTNGLIGLGADLSATYGGSAKDAVEAISSALKGEMDPIEKYGISLNQAAIQQQMMADGTDKLTGKQALAAKQAAIMELLTKQSGDAQGQFAAQTGTLAEQQQILGAKYENITAQIGTKLLPVMVTLVEWGGKAIDWISENINVLGPLAGIIAGVVAVQWLWNAAMAANPIGLVVIAIAGIIAALVLFFTKTELGKKIWQAFTDFLVGAWDWIKRAASVVWDFLKTVWSWSPLGIIVTNWGKIMDFFRKIPGRIGDFFAKVSDIITAPFKAAFNAVAGFWNKTIGKIKFEVPSWVPGIGGKGFAFPTIPMLAEGGTFTKAGVSLVGEHGPELLFGQRGASVVPLDHPAATDALDSAPGMSAADLQALVDRAVSAALTKSFTTLQRLAQQSARQGVTA